MKSDTFKPMTVIISSFLIVLSSCQQNTNKNNLTSQGNISESPNRFSKIPITPLPFGPEALIKYKFPEGWSSGESENLAGEKNLDSTYENKFDEIEKAFGKINFSKTISGPIIKKVEYVNIEDDSLIVNHYPDFQTDFKFRLPDIGPFECFYQYHESARTRAIHTKDNKTFFCYGNIVLYNKATYSAKILNVFNGFNHGGEDFGGYNRFFLIEKNGIINIFKSPISEDSNELIKLSKIYISKDGQILIKKLK